MVPAACRRLLSGEGLAPVDLEFSPERMRAMADAVVERCVAHIDALGRAPACGDVDAAELCRSLREAAPQQGEPLEPLLDRLFDEWIPRPFTAPNPGYLAYNPC